MKNWTTTGLEGTIFEIRDIPRTAWEKNGAPDELAAELLDTDTNRDELSAERERLLARIAEIDKLLGD